MSAEGARGLAVVGTDTGVGKTVVSAVLATAWAATWATHGSVAYWKPLATGADASDPEDPERDSATVARLAHPAVEILPETYLFPEPASPHLAARLAGAAIDPAAVLADLDRHRAVAGRRLVVEGVGGLLVPLTEEGYLLADFLAAARLPCLLVARTGLGTLNHTLLTLEALAARRLAVAGIVLSGPAHPENRRTLERLAGTPVLAHLPPLALDRASVAQAARAFDPDDQLWRSLP